MSWVIVRELDPQMERERRRENAEYTMQCELAANVSNAEFHDRSRNRGYSNKKKTPGIIDVLLGLIMWILLFLSPFIIPQIIMKIIEMSCQF